MNDEGNVHRICNFCHARWHIANDPGYDWNKTDYPIHAPRPMTPEEFQEAVLADLVSGGNKLSKGRFKD